MSYSRRTLAAGGSECCSADVSAEGGDSGLTLELVLVPIGSVVLSNQDLSSHVQADHAGVGHQEEHDELLAHHPQRLVLPTVDRS